MALRSFELETVYNHYLSDFFDMSSSVIPWYTRVSSNFGFKVLYFVWVLILLLWSKTIIIFNKRMRKKTLRVNFNDQLTILCIDCQDVNQNSHYTNLASTRKKVQFNIRIWGSTVIHGFQALKMKRVIYITK